MLYLCNGYIMLKILNLKMISSITIAWIGGLLIVIFSFSFVRVIQLRIQGWNLKKVSPLPLEGFFSIISFLGILLGLTVMFTGVLETFSFSPLNSLVSSLILALVSGIPMWAVVKQLLLEVKSGTLKEMVPGQF